MYTLLFTHWSCIVAGGPAGGNGGSGGNVWVQADSSLNSLTSFRKQVHYRADNGRPGGGSNMTGANAEDLIIKVSTMMLVTLPSAKVCWEAPAASKVELLLADPERSGMMFCCLRLTL